MQEIIVAILAALVIELLKQFFDKSGE